MSMVDAKWVKSPLSCSDASRQRLHEGFQTLNSAVDKIRSERLIVTVCSEPLFATKWVVPRWHRFYAICPDAEVRLQASLHTVDRTRDSVFGATELKRSGIDVSVRLGYGSYAEIMPKNFVNGCWMKPGTALKGAGLIKADADGVHSEVITYHAKPGG